MIAAVEPFCLSEALKHFDAGRSVVPCYANDKRPVGNDWATAWRDRNKLAEHFTSHADANLGLILDGRLIDIECDSAEEELAFRELFDGIDVPRTPCFESTRGRHQFFKGHQRLSALGKGVVHYGDLGIRVGADGKQIQSVIPPSVNRDGTTRLWTVSFDDCEPAELPEIVVDRILESVKRESVVSNGAAPAGVVKASATKEALVEMAVAAMLAMNIQDNNDGSKRLYAYACRAVEHDLTNSEAILAISRASAVRPFLREWKAPQIEKRLRDAESDTTRGLVHLGTDLWKPEGRTDAANGRRLAAKCRDEIRWCDPWRKWLIWDGRRWAIDEMRAIDGFAKAVGKGLWEEFKVHDSANETVFRFVRSTSSAKSIVNMVALTRSEPGIPIRPQELDKDHFLLNVANGTLNLRTGELHPHCREDYLSKLAPVEYSPDATCPVWVAFLDTIFGSDVDTIGFVKRLCGYCFSGDVREQAFPILCGKGANGKSTLLNALLEIAGCDYACKAPESLLLEHARDSHPTVQAQLVGMRFAVVSETGNGHALAESRMKELTGGEKITSRKMHQDYSTFDATAKILLATNYKPEIRGNDHAMWRRIQVLPFDVTIPEVEQDKELSSKLRAEYPGILRWIVEGCLEWQRAGGLVAPPSVVAATMRYRASEDVLGEFLGACCQSGPQASVGATELLSAFQIHSGDRFMNSKRFARLLRNQGFTSKRATSGPHKGRTIWFGVSLT